MKLTKDQINLIIFALEREIDLERMGDEEIIEFAKEENGVDPIYIIELQEIIALFEKQTKYEEGEELSDTVYGRPFIPNFDD